MGESTSGVTSPLAEASEASLAELFARDPLDLTEQDLSRMVEEFRRMRAKWQADEALGVKPGKRSAPEGLTLGDLKL